MKAMIKGDVVILLQDVPPFKKGSYGRVLAVRHVKESDIDVQALRNNGIQMQLGQCALVKFTRGRKVIKIEHLSKA